MTHLEDLKLGHLELTAIDRSVQAAERSVQVLQRRIAEREARVDDAWAHRPPVTAVRERQQLQHWCDTQDRVTALLQRDLDAARVELAARLNRYPWSPAADVVVIGGGGRRPVQVAPSGAFAFYVSPASAWQRVPVVQVAHQRGTPARWSPTTATYPARSLALLDRPRLYVDAPLGYGLDEADTAAAVEFAREVLAADRTW
ncbi:hypothetical protein [Cellulosimicrobium sp. Marseille-Q4280]|uniref:hypothetical protein n=1 Tax=Cellulosimicrobium sp. Marseille-Q4280 TaxID=2937992 RepID=UPI00203A3AC5|nr:hypothetical protein [Cellulosimicrobium sp. Marseille-Q4280]